MWRRGLVLSIALALVPCVSAGQQFVRGTFGNWTLVEETDPFDDKKPPFCALLYRDNEKIWLSEGDEYGALFVPVPPAFFLRVEQLKLQNRALYLDNYLNPQSDAEISIKFRVDKGPVRESKTWWGCIARYTPGFTPATECRKTVSLRLQTDEFARLTEGKALAVRVELSAKKWDAQRSDFLVRELDQHDYFIDLAGLSAGVPKMRECQRRPG